jgi:hypothetical protein
MAWSVRYRSEMSSAVEDSLRDEVFATEYYIFAISQPHVGG